MEIRNNTPQYGYKPAFGMAFLKPEMAKNAQGAIIESADEAVAAFEKVVFDGKSRKLMSRAVRQMIGKHNNDRHYDIRFIADKSDYKGYRLQIIDIKTGNKVEDIGGDFNVTSYDHPKASDYISDSALYGLSFFGRAKAYLKAASAGISGAYRRFTKPMTELPHSFQKISKKTTELEEAANVREANIKQVKKIFTEG